LHACRSTLEDPQLDLFRQVRLGHAPSDVHVVFQKQVALVVKVGFQKSLRAVPQVHFLERFLRPDSGAELKAGGSAVLDSVEQDGASETFHLEIEFRIAAQVVREFSVKTFFAKDFEQMLASDSGDDFRGTELEFVIMVIAVSCVKLLSAHNSTQHTSRKHKV
jgi:hypothetical protein